MLKTNVCRLLDQAKIPYSCYQYEYDENDLSGISVVNKLNQDPKCVYKTIVLVGDKNSYLVCLLPVDKEIDLKKLAKLSLNKKVEPLHLAKLEGLTGYLRGGCSPIGMKKKFPTFANTSLKDIEKVYVSGGLRGLQISLSSQDLIDYCHIKLGDVIK